MNRLTSSKKEEIIYEVFRVYDVTMRDINRFCNYLPRISKISKMAFSTIDRDILGTTLITLCLLRVKFPLLIRESLKDFSKFKELGLLTNNISSYPKYIFRAVEKKAYHKEDLGEIVKVLYEDDEIINLLY